MGNYTPNDKMIFVNSEKKKEFTNDIKRYGADLYARKYQPKPPTVSHINQILNKIHKECIKTNKIIIEKSIFSGDEFDDLICYEESWLLGKWSKSLALRNIKLIREGQLINMKLNLSKLAKRDITRQLNVLCC